MSSKISAPVDPGAKAVVLGMCSLTLTDALRNLQRQNHRLYKDIVYLFSDPRLPEFEKNFINCIDKKEQPTQ